MLQHIGCTAVASENAAIMGDELVMREAVFTGRHTGPMATPDGAIPPTGNTVSFAFADFVRARDGVCVSHRIYWDNVALMAQLSALQ